MKSVELKEGREGLLNLEKENKYVFHGTGDKDLEFLEPRQAYNYINKEQIPDGEPGVFASSKADYAILMALINKKNMPDYHHTEAGSKGDGNDGFKLVLRATQRTLDQLTDHIKGYVYVFDKSLFEPRGKGEVEFVTRQNVSPIKIVEVNKSDLPPNIEIFED